MLPSVINASLGYVRKLYDETPLTHGYYEIINRYSTLVDRVLPCTLYNGHNYTLAQNQTSGRYATLSRLSDLEPERTLGQKNISVI